jgi:AP-3 complex subunit beta
LEALLNLMDRAEGIVLSEVILVLSVLLKKRRGSDDERAALRRICRKLPLVKDSGVRAAILSLVGDMHETHPEFGPLLLRYLARDLETEVGEVKIQALTLAAKLTVLGCESQVPLYVVKLCARDAEFDVRDRAQFLRALLETENEQLKSNLRAVLFPPGKIPKWSNLERTRPQFLIGTLSHYFGRELGGYEPLPQWAEESDLPPDSVRNPVKKIDGKEVVIGDEDDGEEDEEGVIDINAFFGEVKEDGDAEEEEEGGEEEEPAEQTAAAADEGDEEEQDLDGFFD